MKQGKNIPGIVFALLLAVVVVTGVWPPSGKFVRTKHISVVFSMQYPPFDEYTLTDTEADKLLEVLSEMSFSEYVEGPGPLGDGTTCTITSEKGKDCIDFLRPYIVVEGKLYKLNLDEEIFDIVDSIVDAHQGK